MRQVGTFDSEIQARKFVDFLLINKQEARLDPVAEQFEVWIYDENHVDSARAAYGRFQQNPDAEEFQQAHQQAAKIRQQKAAELDRQLKRKRQQQRNSRPPVPNDLPVTKLLILFSVLITLTTMLQEDSGQLFSNLSMTSIDSLGDGHFRYYRSASTPVLQEIREGQLWRLVTPIFIHLSLLHLVMNMLVTYQFGMLLETFLRSSRFLLLVLTTAVFSNLVQFFWAGPLFGGMSGVCFALFGFLWMKTRFEPERGLYLRNQTIYFILGWMVLCFTGILGPIANAAHVGGLICGAAIALVRPAWRHLQRGRRR